MTSTRDRFPRNPDTDSPQHADRAPGKGTLTQQLQRKAAAGPAAPTTAVEPSIEQTSSPAAEDPFGLHLPGAMPPIQRQLAGASEGAPGVPSVAPTAPSGSGEGLPGPVQQKMEHSFGADFSDVRVHQGPQAQSIGAIAYTQGTDLHFAPGQYAPTTSSGQELLGHELAHVVQQKAGRVSVPQGKGAPINADPALEAEADRAGAQAARGERAVVSGQGSGAQPKAAVIQRAVGFEYETTDWHSAMSLDMALHSKDKEKKAAHTEQGDVIERDHEGKLVNAAGSGLTDKETKTLDRVTRDGDKAVDPSRPHVMGIQDSKDFQNLSAKSNKKFAALKKKDVILRGAGFTMEADEVLGSGFSDLEFVTDPFEETKAGVDAMSKAMLTIVEIVRRLFKLAGDRPGGGRLILASELADFGSPVGNVVFLTPNQPMMTGVMQASAAIRLDQVARVMTEYGGVTANETKHEKKDRFSGRAILGEKLSSAAVHNPTGDAPGKARDAIALYRIGDPGADKDLKASHLAATGNAAPPDLRFGSKSLEGLLAVMVQYILTANQALAGYAKTIAPLMARTDLATMFGALAPGERHYLGANNGARFISLVKDAVAGIAMDKDIFEKGLYHSKDKANGGPGAHNDVLAGLTREDWAKGISQGVDLLTVKDFPAANGDELESMGALGDTTGTVGQGANQTNDAPIFEFRGMGAVSYSGLYHRALDVFRYIVGVNEGSTDTFKDTATEFMTKQNDEKNNVKQSLNVKKAVRQVKTAMENDLKAMLR